MKKIKILFFILLAIFLSWFIFFFNFNNKIIEELSFLEDEKEFYNEDFDRLTEISERLNEENYNKVWINPEEYETFWDFLTDFSSFSWITIEPINENFSIWLKNDDWSYLFIPFRYNEDKENFLDEVNKNLAILDIYEAYTNWLVYWWINSNSWEKILFEDELQHSKTYILNNIFNVDLNNNSNNIYNIIDSLTTTENIWLENMELLSYLYDLTWEYLLAEEEREKLCKKYSSTCDSKINLNISGKILDSSDLPLEWVKVELLNNPLYSTISNEKWEFSLKLNFYSFSHLRFKASKMWYTDWFITYSLNTSPEFINEQDLFMDFTISQADNLVTINNYNIEKYKKWRYYIIENKYSKYFIPKDWLYYYDGQLFEWDNIDVYTFQLNKDNNLDNLLENDAFSSNYWYLWNIMKTFWMPYIQFFDSETQQELFVKSSNPMILQNNIYNIKELYENSAQTFETITEDDMQFLVNKSSELWAYPIDYEFLIKNDFLRWPACWSLDKIKGIWFNVWSRVLNKDWLVELPFYHIKENLKKSHLFLMDN